MTAEPSAAGLQPLPCGWQTLWGLRGPRAALPPGLLACAVGDIHGRADLLARLHETIARWAAAESPAGERWIVYLGDYVDRGPASRQVLDLLLQAPLAGFRAVHLMGNHEAALLAFLADPASGRAWLKLGGTATLRSYGLTVPSGGFDPAALAGLSRDLAAALPGAHRTFLEGLTLSHRLGGVFFAHAGVRPGVPLEQQEREDLLWIRRPFLKSWRDHGALVVHGHCARERPQVRRNRIGIDTGAYLTDRLTCLVLKGAERGLLVAAGG